MQYKQHKQYRCQNYDYSQNGFYFITICAKNRELLFGEIIEGKMNLSDIGKIAEKFWLEIPAHFPFIKLDEFVFMPNHLHGIIEIDNQNDYDGRNEALPRSYTGKYPKMSKISPKSGSISTIIGSFKSIATKTINIKLPDINFAWQPRFHDRIIRNEEELNKTRQYILDNPEKLEMDQNNSDCLFM